MALSPNYGWAEPDNSSLVKNGAQDIRALGDAIDTSLWNVGFGQAGKNKIINGDFGVWQRGTSFTPTTSVYTVDRWFYASDLGSGATITQQTFTPGTAPVAGYEGSYFVRYARTSGTTSYNQFYQPIEDVRTFAGQTVTFSFWAKADAATSITLDGYQVYGTGGSSPTSMGLSGTASLTTSWQRFTFNASVPSIAGKTIGTNSLLRPMFNYGTGNKVVDLWGVQLEYGSKATPFETATGTIQGELAACQRYCQVANNQFGQMYSTTSARIIWPVQVQMRVTPTVTYPTGTFTNFIEQVGIGNLTPTAFSATSTDNNFIYTNATGMTSGTLFNAIRYNGTTFIASSEL